MSTSRNSRFQSSVAGTAATAGRRPSYGTSLGSSGIGSSYGTSAAAGSSSYGGTAGYSGYSSSYGAGDRAYSRTGYVPSSAAVANALSTSSAVLNDVAKPTTLSSTTSGYASTTGYNPGITTTVTTANNDSYGGVRSPLRRRFYSGANTDTSLQDLLRAAGCSDPEAVTAGAPKYAGSAAGSPAVVGSPIRREATRSYRGARSNQELTLTDAGVSPATGDWRLRNGTSITNLDTAGTTTETPIPTWRSKSLSSPTHAASKVSAVQPVITTSSAVNSYQHDYDNHAVTARPYSRSSRSTARLEHADSRDRMENSTTPYHGASSRSRLDHMDSRDSRMDSQPTDQEPSYYTKPPAMDRVSSISREMGTTRSESNYRVSTPRGVDRGTPHRERRPPPVETMYGDESPSSPMRRAIPPSVSREDLVKEYELIYTPKDRPTSEKLANGGETMDIPPPPMPSRSVRATCSRPLGEGSLRGWLSVGFNHISTILPGYLACSTQPLSAHAESG